jgi:tetratricopeptide (TPR) repeat protein
MPKVIKKRAAKKKPKQEEEVKSVALQTIEKLKKRQKQVITVAGAVIALILLIIIVSAYSSSQKNKAYAIEMDAGRYYYGGTEESLSKEDRFNKAIELYQQSIDIKASPTALYYLGNSYFNLGDYDKAVEQYNKFVSKFSSEDTILPLVYQKLASSYFKSGKNDKALEALGRLAKVENGIFKDTALILEAQHYESAGDTAKGLQKYRELMLEFPSSPWTAAANAKVTAADNKESDKTEEKAPAEKDEKTEAAPPAEPEAK